MADVAKLTKKRLGEILREQGLINEEHIQEALDRQDETGELLGRALIELGYVTERDIARVLCTQFGLPYLDVENCSPDKELIEQIPDSFIKKYSFLPVDMIGQVVVIAVSGVFGQEFFDRLNQITGREIQIVISTREKIKQALVEKLSLQPGDVDVEDTDEYIDREPDEKDPEDESEIMAELSGEGTGEQTAEPETTSSVPEDEELEKTRTFTLDENDNGEPVIDLESEAERILEETEQELNEEENKKKEQTNQDENEETSGDESRSKKTEQESSIST